MARTAKRVFYGARDAFPIPLYIISVPTSGLSLAAIVSLLYAQAHNGSERLAIIVQTGTHSASHGASSFAGADTTPNNVTIGCTCEGIGCLRNQMQCIKLLSVNTCFCA